MFVAEGDEADSELKAFFGDLDDGDADETKNDADAQVVEGEGNLLGAGELCLRHGYV